MLLLNNTDFEDINILLDKANNLCFTGSTSNEDVFPDLKKAIATIKEVLKNGEIENANFC